MLFPFSSAIFEGWTSAGYQAVTFFFVLSGFILTYVYSGETEKCPLNVNTGDFLKARFARISPAYLLALGLALPAFIYGTFVSRMVPFDIFVAGIFLVPTFLQSWYPPAALAWNSPAWSLSVEVLFYFSFHSLTNLALKFSSNCLLILSYSIVVVVAVLRHLWFPWTNIVSGSWNFNFAAYFPLLHLPQFLFGIALGRVYLFGKFFSPQTHLWIMVAGLLSLILLFGIGPMGWKAGLSEATKLGDMYSDLAKETYKPIEGLMAKVKAAA